LKIINNRLLGIGQVIRGWDEGVITMKKGEVAQIVMTADYAYGSKGFPAWGIMPDSTLMFEIEIISF
jgi:peptidylprolyl isomerase